MHLGAAALTLSSNRAVNESAWQSDVTQADFYPNSQQRCIVTLLESQSPKILDQYGMWSRLVLNKQTNKIPRHSVGNLLQCRPIVVVVSAKSFESKIGEMDVSFQPKSLL